MISDREEEIKQFWFKNSGAWSEKQREYFKENFKNIYRRKVFGNQSWEQILPWLDFTLDVSDSTKGAEMQRRDKEWRDQWR